MSFDSGHALQRPVRRDYRGNLERLARITVTTLVVLKDAVVSSFTAQQKLTVTDRATVYNLTNISESEQYSGTRRSYGYVEWKTPVDVIIQPSEGYGVYYVPNGQYVGDNTWQATPVTGLNAPTLSKKAGDITGWNPANGHTVLGINGYWRIRYTVNFVRTGNEGTVFGMQVVLKNVGNLQPDDAYGTDYVVVEGPIAVNQVYTVQGEYTGNRDIWFSDQGIALQGCSGDPAFAVRVLETSLLVEYLDVNEV